MQERNMFRNRPCSTSDEQNDGRLDRGDSTRQGVLCASPWEGIAAKLPQHPCNRIKKIKCAR